jgi:hypothetical protein
MMAFPYFIFELLFPLVEALVWVAIPVVAGRVGVLSLMDRPVAGDDRSGCGTALSLAAIAVEAAAFSFFHGPRGNTTGR